MVAAVRPPEAIIRLQKEGPGRENNEEERARRVDELCRSSCREGPGRRLRVAGVEFAQGRVLPVLAASEKDPFRHPISPGINR